MDVILRFFCRSRLAAGASGDLDGQQLELLSCDSDADADLLFRNVPVRVLENLDGPEVLLGSGRTLDRARRIFHLAAGPGGELRLRDSVPGLSADVVAAAPYACSAA